MQAEPVNVELTGSPLLLKPKHEKAVLLAAEAISTLVVVPPARSACQTEPASPQVVGPVGLAVVDSYTYTTPLFRHIHVEAVVTALLLRRA